MNSTRCDYLFFRPLKVPLFHRGGHPGDGQQRQTGQKLPVSKCRPKSKRGLVIISRTADKFFTAAGHSGGATNLIHDAVVMAPRTIVSSRSLDRRRGGACSGATETRRDVVFCLAGQQEALRDGGPQPGGHSGEAAVEKPGSPIRLTSRRRQQILNGNARAFL